MMQTFFKIGKLIPINKNQHNREIDYEDLPILKKTLEENIRLELIHHVSTITECLANTSLTVRVNSPLLLIGVISHSIS